MLRQGTRRSRTTAGSAEDRDGINHGTRQRGERRTLGGRPLREGGLGRGIIPRSHQERKNLGKKQDVTHDDDTTYKAGENSEFQATQRS